MAHRYLDESLAEAHPGDIVSLRGPEARHAVAVSRIGVGEAVSVGNGAGLVASGEVVHADRDRLELRVDQVLRSDRPAPRITLVQALAKGDRDELAVQAATELGVDRIIPWAASRSVARWDAAKAIKGRARWASIAREASKQSLRAWVPEVGEPVTTAQLAALAEPGRMLVLEPAAASRLTELEPDGRDLLLVVGPEGGIAPHELDTLSDAGAELVRLGPEVLRTSTAGPAAIAALSLLLSRW